MSKETEYLDEWRHYVLGAFPTPITVLYEPIPYLPTEKKSKNTIRYYSNQSLFMYA